MGDLRLNPYADVTWTDVERHKAQLHAHTSYPQVEGHSGSDPPEVVIDDYREAGYTVLALTGHEYNIEEPTWPWTDWDCDPGDLGMVAVRAAELGGSDGGIEHDLLSLFCDLADTTGMSVHEALEAIGDRGGLAVFPHPSRYHEDGGWYVEYFRAHPNLLGVEVVNAADRYPTATSGTTSRSDSTAIVPSGGSPTTTTTAATRATPSTGRATSSCWRG